jgi:hypothetical protein
MITLAAPPSRACSRWLKGTTMVLIAMALVATAGARQAGEPQTIGIGGLRVVGKDDTAYVHLFGNPDAGTVLSLCNVRGLPELNLSIMPNGDRQMYLYDSNKHSRIGIVLTKDGLAMLSLGGGLEQQGASLRTHPDSGTFLQFYDKKKRTRIRLGLQPDDSPSLEFFDEKGKSTFVAPGKATPPAQEE